MNEISKILIPFNLKESALNALNYAIEFSRNTKERQIKLLYVVGDDESQTESEIGLQLSKTVDQFNSKTAYPFLTYQIEKGDIVTQTLKAKNEFKADLILMGTKGDSEGSKVKSTNTSSLIHQAECPVIAIPKSFNTFKLKNITLAIDKTEIENPELLTVLLAIARKFDAKIHVLTIYDEDDKDFFKERENESALTYYFEKFYDKSSAIRSSNIAKSIIEYDKRKSIDMLVVIPRNHAKEQLPSEGKLTQYLSVRSEIPILTID